MGTPGWPGRQGSSSLAKNHEAFLRFFFFLCLTHLGNYILLYYILDYNKYYIIHNIILFIILYYILYYIILDYIIFYIILDYIKHFLTFSHNCWVRYSSLFEHSESEIWDQNA
jgi:hypothetical protein